MIKNGTIKQGDDDDDDDDDDLLGYLMQKQMNKLHVPVQKLDHTAIVGEPSSSQRPTYDGFWPLRQENNQKTTCHNDRCSMIFSFLASHESHVATSSEFSRYQQINRQSLL